MAEVVDIMVVYDTGATTWVAFNGSMTTFSQDAVNRMNQALANSGISDHEFRLVHSMSVDYTTLGLSTDLTNLKENINGDFTAVHTARDTYGADLVTMLVDTGSAYGTVGYGYAISTINGNSNAAFTVCSIRSVAISHTLTHEVGHNLGAGHSKYQKNYPGPSDLADYAAGWYFTATEDREDYHTIMAYSSDGYGQHYDEAPLFSSPLITYKGTVAGDTDDGDNTRILTQTLPNIADYKEEKVDLTPDVDLAPILFLLLSGRAS